MSNINTKVISKSLNAFAKQIKIPNTVYSEIRKRRDTICKYVQKYFDENSYSLEEKFNMGSYKIKTGVKYHDNDYDIDYAIVIDGSHEISSLSTLKERLVNFLRPKLKDHYKMKIIVSNKKHVITIKFKNTNDETMFHLDMPMYIKNGEEIELLKRNSIEIYSLELSDPKSTFQRQSNELDESNGPNYKRNAIILLKHLMSRNHLMGISSIYITDKIISFSSDLDTFTLIKQFIKSAKNEVSFVLSEEPKSELINDPNLLNAKANKIFNDCFTKETTKETYDKLNAKFNHKLPELDKEELDKDIDQHHGG